MPGTEAEGVAIWVGEVDLAGAPSLVERGEVNGGFDAVALVEAARRVEGEEVVDFCGVVEFNVDGAGRGIAAHVNGELQDSIVADEVDDAIAEGEFAMLGPSQLKIENFRVEAK